MPTPQASVPSPAPRPFWLCADDYGMAPGVSTAIRDLIARGRLNATSVMTVSPHLDRREADALQDVNARHPGAAVGLHVTLTAPFCPLTANYSHARGTVFPALPATLAQALARRFDRGAVADEVERQFDAFERLFGRTPDFVDGHQHVHVFPQIREAVLAVAKRRAHAAWIRQCGRVRGAGSRTDLKGALLDRFSRSFRRRAAEHGLATNPAFAGTYVFEPKADYARLFPRFLAGLPAGAVVMCHPGHVDAALESIDPVTHLRQREYDYLAGAEFPRVLAEAGMALGNGYLFSAMPGQ